MKLFRKIKNEISPSRGSDCKSVFWQWFEIGRVAVTAQFTPAEYYMYGFHKKNTNIHNITRYISNSTWIEQVWPKLNSNQWDHILQNKWLFNLYYSSRRLPVTNVYGYYSNSGGLTHDNRIINNLNELTEYIRSIHPETLVVKPLFGGKGKFVIVLNNIEYHGSNISGRGISGEKFIFTDIVERILKANKRLYGVLLEEKIEQCSFLKKINPFTTNTLRIITLLKKNGEPELLGGIIRCGIKGSEVDNLSRGGFSRGIDINHGKISGRGLISKNRRAFWIDKHPDLDLPFKESEIPMWDTVVDTIKDFSRYTPFARIVGWDMVLSESGPRVIEGNPDLALDETQAHSQGYLTDKLKAEFAEFGINTDDTLTRIKIGEFWNALKRWL